MDKYHIYEEIGKGDFSQVFKGREKKKIEYVAIKRVEKSMMSKVVNEVQIMHKLDSPHMLKFHDWYETRNNLWLILEYCTGSDLESLLLQDGHLPESSVRSLGLDMLAGLKYLHGLGLLHCDLRPRNFLVDEYGILKICDFKLARRVPKVPLGPLDGPGAVMLEQRGTPPYMAPELWRDDGLHSFTSDFWALGCVLYELRRGQAPFGDEETIIKRLLDNIETVEPVSFPLAPYKKERPSTGDNNSSNNNSNSNQYSSRQSPSTTNSRRQQQQQREGRSPGKVVESLPSMSAELGDLLCWLLEKPPQNRCKWAEVSVHPFWGHKSNAIPQGLPEEVAFQGMLRGYEKENERSIEQALVRECGMTEMQAHDMVQNREALPTAPVPAKPGSAAKLPLQPHVSDSTPIRPAAKSAGESSSHGGGGSGGNRLADVFTIQEDAKAEAKEVKRHRAGSERTPDRNQRPLENKDLPPSQYNTPVVNRAGPPVAAEQQNGGNAVSNGANYSTNGAHAMDSAHRVTTPHNKDGRGHHAEGSFFGASPTKNDASHFYGNDSAAVNGGVDQDVTGVNQVTPGIFGDMTPATGAAPGTADAGGAGRWPVEMSAEALLLHAQDTQVKPVVGNKNIETLEKYPVKTANMPFDVLTLQAVQEMDGGALEQHLTAVYKAVQRATADAAGAIGRGGAASGSTMCAERIQMLSYLVSIGSVSEVANIVLNTNFVSLMLKLVKGPNMPASSTLESRSGSRGSSREGARQMVVTPAMASLRCCAATVLATMLRYATFVSPPSSKTKDEHLLPVLTSILRSEYAPNGTAPSATRDAGTRLDPKLKRRVIAALGETLFYISSQEGEAEGEDARWIIPTATISCLVRCLKDDSDEIVRHYAAKTIENVLAQGGQEHKRRLVSVDVATRLLEMSQHGRNDAMQATCGMALSHMFTFVMTCEQAAAEEPPSPARGASVRGARKINSSPSTASDNGVAPGAGARFMVKVLDRGGLPAILETLNDGQPKLQQAYLNVLNLLFALPAELAKAIKKDIQVEAPTASPLNKAARVFSRASNTVPGAAELRSTRQFFLRSATLVPTILKLVETGGSTAVRAKALLTAQLFCDHQPALLTQFCERRLPSILMRLVEPLVLAASGSAGQSVRSSLQQLTRGSGAAEPTTVPKGSAAYPMHAALSFLAFVRAACTSGSAELAVQIARIAAVDGDPTYGGSYGGASPSPTKRSTLRSPGAGSSSYRSSPAVNQRLTPSGADKRGGSSHGGHRPSSRSGAIAPDISRIHSLTELVRGTLAAAVLPSLRRLILADGPDLVLAVTSALAELPKARAGLTTISASDPFAVEAAAALSAADQALLAALEGIAAVDAADLLLGIGSHSARSNEQAYGFTSNTVGAGSFAEALSLLLPVVAGLCSHSDGDVRVIVGSALRRLLPGALRALLHCVKERTLLQTRCIQCMQVPCGDALALLLSDQAPIPQYAVRMLNESLLITSDLADLVVRQLTENGVLPALVGLFGRQAQHAGEWGSEQDPQLTLLLRSIMERRGAALSLLEAGLPLALCGTIHHAVYGQYQLEEQGRNMAMTHRLNYLLTLQPMIDLLHVVLHYVIRQLSTEADKDAAHACNLVNTCNALVSALLSTLTTACLDLAGIDPAIEGASTVPHIADTTSRSLGILFDLFPDTVSDSICRANRDLRNAYAIDLRIKGRDSTACDVFSAVLVKPSAHMRLRSRLLKIIAGVATMAPQLGTAAAVSSMLQSTPMQRALAECAAATEGNRGADADTVAFAQLARTVLTSAAAL